MIMMKPFNPTEKDKVYLPDHQSDANSWETRQDLREMQIAALTKPNCCPFTSAQAGVFAASRACNERAGRWLRWRGWLLILCVPILAGVVPVLPLGEMTTLEKQHTLAIALVTAIASILLSNSLSMMFTGNLPEFATSSQNHEHAVLGELHDTVCPGQRACVHRSVACTCGRSHSGVYSRSCAMAHVSPCAVQ